MDEAEKKRVCRPCGVEKLLTEFNRDSSEWGGYRYYCKMSFGLLKVGQRVEASGKA